MRYLLLREVLLTFDARFYLDLISYAKKLRIANFRGVFMRDTLPKSGPLEHESGIVNLDSSKGRGTHWISYMKVGSIVQYYDSFGVPPPVEILKYFIHNVILFNSEQEQKFDQVICGHLCLIDVYT